MRLVLDACVLYPPVLREIMLAVADRGGFVPLWSARILAEWQIAASKRGAEAAARAADAIARLQTEWPQAEIVADPALEARLVLPDPADAHVLASAITGGAEAIVTLNLRDFPRNRLDGLRAVAPDDLLMDLWLADCALVETAVALVQARTEALSGQQRARRSMLKRSKLPRLGKALDG